MNQQLFEDLEKLPQLLDKVQNIASTYLSGINDVPTGLRNLPALELSLPERGEGTESALAIFNQHIKNLLVASSGPRYLGFVTGGGTPAAIAGDWLASVFDQNTQATTGFGDASALLELETIRMLLDLFNLPDTFFGGFVTGATMSNFTGLAVARQWYGKQYGKDFAREGLSTKIKVYAATPHSSSIKALAMLGIGSSNIELVPVLPDREAMDIEALLQVLKDQPSGPFILLTSGGTVNTVDFDDLNAIAALKKEYNFWWHIDAAFGAFASCSPQYNHLLRGWEQADSITVDAHKWLNVPYDSGIFLTRKEHAPLQMQSFQNSSAPYLGDPMENFSYLNFVPENSRRFRALPAWFTLTAYGKEGYRQIIEENIRSANSLGAALEKSGIYKLVTPVRLNVVCFTVTQEKYRAEKVKHIVKQLNANGKVFMTPTVYKGVPCLRAAFVNWRTTEEDIQIVLDELIKVYE